MEVNIKAAREARRCERRRAKAIVAARRAPIDVPAVVPAIPPKRNSRRSTSPPQPERRYRPPCSPSPPRRRRCRSRSPAPIMLREIRGQDLNQVGASVLMPLDRISQRREARSSRGSEVSMVTMPPRCSSTGGTLEPSSRDGRGDGTRTQLQSSKQKDRVYSFESKLLINALERITKENEHDSEKPDIVFNDGDRVRLTSDVKAFVGDSNFRVAILKAGACGSILKWSGQKWRKAARFAELLVDNKEYVVGAEHFCKLELLPKELEFVMGQQVLALFHVRNPTWELAVIIDVKEGTEKPYTVQFFRGRGRVKIDRRAKELKCLTCSCDVNAKATDYWNTKAPVYVYEKRGCKKGFASLSASSTSNDSSDSSEELTTG